jgi:hypothetical protein
VQCNWFPLEDKLPTGKEVAAMLWQVSEELTGIQRAPLLGEDSDAFAKATR